MPSYELSTRQGLTLLRLRLLGVPTPNALRHVRPKVEPRGPRPYHYSADLAGQRFGRLTVIRRAVERYHLNGDTRWWCRCRCGRVVAVRKAALIHSNTRSCGCLHRDVAAALGATKFKHGHTHPYTPEYISWCNMLRKHRRLTCQRWRDSFADFLEDMGPKPAGTKLIRLQAHRGYRASNVVWR
jgi:hypothetical protein